jgi:two-component system, sensor histidine kinase and response regulator
MSQKIDALSPQSSAQFQDSVEFRLLDSAYQLGFFNIALTTLMVPLFGYLFYGLIPLDIMREWGAALVVNVVLSWPLYIAWYFKKKTVNASNVARWRWMFFALLCVAGLSWTVGPCLMIPVGQGVQLALFVGILLAVCAVSATTMAAQPAAMNAFLISALVPAAIAAWLTDNPALHILGVIIACGLASLVLTGFRASVDMRDHFEVRAQLRQSVRDANAARQFAEQASLAKSRFLANMSHELRSPLNAVIGAAQLLKTERNNPASQEHLVDAIQRSGKNLLGLIDNVLDISRIEAGEMHLELDDFHLLDCIDTALATAALAAQSKGLALACIVEPGLQAWRHGDGLRVRQVLLNLLGNAVKFTEEGEVIVKVQRGRGADEVIISIRDTGVGIAPASLASIFEPFRQSDDAAARRFGGSGLGLSIVHQLAQAMGGSVTVQSQVGQGSQFKLTLPLPTASKIPDAPAALDELVAYFEPHEPSAQALGAHLKRMGCLAQRVQSKSDLQDWLRAQQQVGGAPWLLLACDTAAAADLLEAAHDVIAPQRIVGMVRGDALAPKGQVNLLKLPLNMVKPVLRTALVSRLVTLRRGALSAPMTLSAKLDGQTPTARGHILVVEDDPLNQMIVCRLLSHEGYTTTTACSGQQALDLMATQPFDLVLMDMQMPGMDGLEVTRRLRAGQAGTAGLETPIVALTANAFAHDRAACLEAGMNDFLSKPVQIDLLVAAIARWLKDGAMPRYRKPVLRRVPVHTGVDIGVDLALDLEGNGPATVQQVADFDASVLAALPMVADGTEPDYAQELTGMFSRSLDQTLGDLKAALAASDSAWFLRLVHTLKSSSASVGALALAEVAEDLEKRLRNGRAPREDMLLAIGEAAQRFKHASQISEQETRQMGLATRSTGARI